MANLKVRIVVRTTKPDGKRGESPLVLLTDILAALWADSSFWTTLCGLDCPPHWMAA